MLLPEAANPSSSSAFPGGGGGVGSRDDAKMRRSRFHSVFDRFCPFIADTAAGKTCCFRSLANHAAKPPIKNGENGDAVRAMSGMAGSALVRRRLIANRFCGGGGR